MPTTLNNGTFNESNLSGATVQGNQYFDPGAVQVGNGAPTTFTATDKQFNFSTLRLGVGGVISMTQCAIKITSTADTDAFGDWNIPTPGGVSASFSRCLISLPGRIAFGDESNSNFSAIDCVIRCSGLALYGTETVLRNTILTGMNRGLGIRANYTNPVQNVTIQDSTFGFLAFGDFPATVQDVILKDLSADFDFSVHQTFSANWDLIDVRSRFSFFWNSFPTGTFTRKHSFSARFTDELNSPLDINVYLADVLGNVAYSGITTGGQMPRQELIRTIYSAGSANSTQTIESNRIPYTYRERVYGYEFFEDLVLSFDSAVEISKKKSPYPYNTAATAAEALLDSDPVTANQIHDHSRATYEQAAQMQYPQRIITTDGKTLTFALDVTIDNAEAGVVYDFGGDAVTYREVSLGTFGLLQLAPTKRIALAQSGVFAAPWAIPVDGQILVSDGTTDLSSWEISPGATINLIAGATTATVQVKASVVASLTTGSGVTIISSPVIFSGFPTGANANGVVYNSVIAILNLSDNTLFTADVEDGSVSASLSTIGDGVGPFSVWGDGHGVRRTIAQSIAATRIEEVSLSGLFEEYIAEDGTVLVGLAPPDAGVSYDQPNERFEFDDSATHRFAGIINQFDALTSTQAGQSFDSEAVRGIQFIQNDSYKRILIPTSLVIAANGAAVNSPSIIDCLILGTDLSDRRVPGSILSRPPIAFAFQSPASNGGIDANDMEIIINAIRRVEAQLTADEQKGADRYQRLDKDSGAVILDKAVVFDPDTGYTITEYEGPQ